MHWLIDAGAIKTGGGVQIALNRLPLLTQSLIDRGLRLSVLLPSSGPLAKLELPTGIETLRSPNNWAARILFEYIHLPAWMNKNAIKGIYTVFGFGLPHPKHIKSIVSTANATTCYPDSPYWHRLNTAQYLKRRLYTRLRQNRLTKADYWVFETEIMRERSCIHLGLPKEKTQVINPSPTSFLANKPAMEYSQKKSFVITLLTGNESHKNLDCFVRICEKLSQIQATNIRFNITLTKEQLSLVAPKNLNLNRLDNINYLGKLPQNSLQSLYDETDIIMNLSELESFSNNYMEAWKAGIAQICSDRDFSRHICRDSALFIEPFDTEKSAYQITQLISNPDELNKLAASGKQCFHELTAPSEYIDTTINLIKTLNNINSNASNHMNIGTIAS